MTTTYKQGIAHIKNLTKNGARLLNLETMKAEPIPADFLKTAVSSIKACKAQAATYAFLPFEGCETFGDFGIRVTKDGKVDSGLLTTLETLAS